MMHHVLVPTDGAENAERAVRFSAQVADRRQQAEVTVVYVYLQVPSTHIGMAVLQPEQPFEEMGSLSHELNADEQAHAQEIVDHAVELIRSLVTSPDVTVSGRVVVDTRIDDAILKVVVQTQATLIAVATPPLIT